MVENAPLPPEYLNNLPITDTSIITSKKPPFRLIILISSLILGLCLLLVGGYFWFNHQSPQTVSETTYSKYDTRRISFEYPSNWKVSTQSGLFIRSPSNELYGIEFAYLDFTDFASALKDHPEAKISKVDGKRVVQYTEFQEPSPGVAATYYHIASIEQPIGKYTISAMASKPKALRDYQPVFDHILQTVKFHPFVTNGCGGVDSQGELICSCDGNLIKPLPPIGGLGLEMPSIGKSSCNGTCGSCCYRGNVQQSEFPICGD